MLDEYKEMQPAIYQMMKNAVLNEKVSHAYLLDIKNCPFGNEMALAFVKYLLCPFKKSNLENCGQCTQCQKIDDFNYTELKIIDPDGLWIKKEQLDELQEEFSKKAIVGAYKIYIIHQVERLNKASANSLLKFLEEPESGIIAILTTDNLFQVLETIRSRCQIFSFHKQLQVEEKNTAACLPIYIRTSLFEQEETYLSIVHHVIEFIEYYEKRRQETLLYTTKLWHKYIGEKEELLFAFDIMIFFYHDVIHQKCHRDLKIFHDEKSLIAELAQSNTMEQLTHKMNVLMNLKKKIKINMNNGLLIDKLIISLGGERND